MSSLETQPFQRTRRVFNEYDGQVSALPSLLNQSQGASYLPEFVGTMVDRSIYGATEGGAGAWAFGSLRTPQRFVVDYMYGWDPNVHLKPDPNWNTKAAELAWNSVPDYEKAAALYVGGQALIDEIKGNSVSRAHFQQRLNELGVVSQAKFAIDAYDRESFFLGYATQKTLSAVINYVASDPTTVISIAATAGLAPAATAGKAAAGAAEATARASTLASLSMKYNRTFKAAGYLWNGVEGASTAYSSADQMNRDGYRVQGDTFQGEQSLGFATALGAGLGLTLSAGMDVLGKAWKPRSKTNKSPSIIENALAASPDGHLNTPIDHASMSRFRNAKSRLERSLDATEGPESSTRRMLLDDEYRERLGWGSSDDMDDLADWVEKNKPTTQELEEHVGKRLQARAMNHAESLTWADEVEDYVLGGGDPKNFFRKKTADMLRTMMGEDFARYRFVIDYLEEATGDARLVAEFVARGDKERIIRVGNAINSNAAIARSETLALNEAAAAIKKRAADVVADEADQAVNRINDNITQGRFQGAIDILDEMRREVDERTGQAMGEVDGAINALNDAFDTLNNEAFEKMDHFKEMVLALKKLRDAVRKQRAKSNSVWGDLRRATDPDATNADVFAVTHGNPAVRDPDIATISDEVAEALEELNAARAQFDRANDAVSSSLDEVRRTRMEIVGRAGKAALDRTMETVGGFPLWKVSLSNEGADTLRRVAIRQTKGSNRWKVEFVDRFLGADAADNALTSGTSPLRPVRAERPTIKPFTVEEQDRILSDELKKIEPEIAAIREGAKDVSLDSKIASTRAAAADVDAKTAQIKQVLDRNRSGMSPKMVAQYESLIAKRERLSKRLNKMADRMESTLDNQLETLNRDVRTHETITPESLAATRRDAARVAHSEAAKKLEGMPADALASPNGRKLRNKVRRLAAEIDGGTEYNVLGRERSALAAEVDAAKARVDELTAKGALDGDSALVAARKELEYTEKQLAKVDSAIKTVEGRPAAMRRSYALNGDKPNVDDVVEISRLRAFIGWAVQNGDEAMAEKLNRQLYEKYGDSNAIARWPDLEEFFSNRIGSSMRGESTEELISVTMDGRRVKFTVAEKPRGDVVERLGIVDKLSTAPTTMPGTSRKAGTEITEGSIKETEDRALGQRLAAAVESDAEAQAIRARNEGQRNIRAVEGNPIDAATVQKPQPAKATVNREPTPADEIAEKSRNIKDKLFGKEGQRLLIMNGVMLGASRIPGLRGLGRALFRLQTAGTGFGELHNTSRALDLIVASFNMLDSPEALTRSLGLQTTTHRTLQNFKDQAAIAINEAAAAYANARRLGQWTAESDMNVKLALDSGDSSALNAGERQVFDVIQGHYKRVGDRLNVSHPGMAMDNYRPREGNAHVILRNRSAAQADFADAFYDNMTSSAGPLPNSLCDEFGITRGTTWSALSPEQKAAFEARVRAYCNDNAAATVSRLTNSITEDGVGYRIAATSARSNAARVLENAVVNDGRVARWYIQSPLEEFKRYMEVRAPTVMFNAQLSEIVGTPTTFDDVLDVVGREFADLNNEVSSEAAKALKTLRDKWEYHTGRAQYKADSLLDPTLRTATGLVRGSAGSFWGMAGLATEVPRAVAAAKMYGGSLRGLFDIMASLREARNMDTLVDIAHAHDQYSTMAHSSFGTSIGTTSADRFIAPWERFFNVVAGREAMTQGGQEMGRVSGSIVSFAEAFGETGMRAGGMQYFSGMARVIADRQAKRFISRNIDKMADLANRLNAIGVVTENTPQARQAFKDACSQAGIPFDVAIQMNHAGLLKKNVTDNVRLALQGQDQVFSLVGLRNSLNDESFGAMVDFLTMAHNFHVPTSSIASSVEAGRATEKLFYLLTSYSRSFATNVAFRTAANGRFAAMMSTFAAVMIGENLYQGTRDVATGKKRVEDIEQEWEQNPAEFFMKRAIKSPWLGAHNSLALSVIGTMTGDPALGAARGNNILGPILDSGQKFARMLYTNEKTGERDFSFLQTHTPIFNTWYSRLAVGAMEQ